MAYSRAVFRSVFGRVMTVVMAVLMAALESTYHWSAYLGMPAEQCTNHDGNGNAGPLATGERKVRSDSAGIEGSPGAAFAA